MENAFVAIYVLTGLALIVALSAIPLAARGARQSLWWTQAAAALVLALTLTAVLYWEVFGREIALWRCLIVYLSAIVFPTVVAGWSARAAARTWPGVRRTSALLGTLVGLTLALAANAVFSREILPTIDIIHASTDH